MINYKKNYKIKKQFPFVSLCTPTFNRRPFIPIIIKCIEQQKYPHDKIEWVIVDDGTDKIEDLVINLPYVNYIKIEEKISLGKKRNICNKNAKGDIIIYMDDDDYYPPERISHAVETLRLNPKALCAGSSIMHVYFKDIDKMYQFGPYGKNHSTAATFAFRKELLEFTSYNEDTEVAEEKYFLKNYTIPFVQLDTFKTILVMTHKHNSINRKNYIDNVNDPAIKLSDKKVEDFIKDQEIKKFFIEDIDMLLDNYEYGKPENKQKLLKQLNDMKIQREKKAEEYKKNIDNYNSIINTILNKINNSEHILLIQELKNENKLLIDKINYLENKFKELIKDTFKIKGNKITEEYDKNINDYNSMINKIVNKNNNSEHLLLIHELTEENKLLKDKMDYLENKIKEIIKNKINNLKSNN